MFHYGIGVPYINQLIIAIKGHNMHRCKKCFLNFLKKNNDSVSSSSNFKILPINIRDRTYMTPKIPTEKNHIKNNVGMRNKYSIFTFYIFSFVVSI